MFDLDIKEIHYRWLVVGGRSQLHYEVWFYSEDSPFLALA